MCDNHISLLYFAIINVILPEMNIHSKCHGKQPLSCLKMLIIIEWVKLFKKLFGL